MDIGTAGFEACVRAPSPAPNLPAMPSFGVPTHVGTTQHTQFLPTSSIESLASSLYSRPYGIESGSRTSWSSAEVDWARRGTGIEESHCALQQENAELLKQVSIWQAKFETLQTAYNLLLERVPAPPEAELHKLNHADYQLIDYWYKHQWVSSSGDHITDIAGKVENEDEDVEADAEGEELRSRSPAPGAQRGQGRSRAGINVSMGYIQDKDGWVIDGHRAREICIHARAIFVSFAMQGKQFSSWGDTDAISRRTFYKEIVIRFEELQYCDLDWKAEQIAIDTFPGWKVTWLKKQKKTLEQQNGTKCARQGSAVEKSDPKWLKATEITSMSSSPPEASTTSQRPVPIVNIIPNTPIRAPPAAASFNMQGLEQHHLCDPSLLQPDKPHYDFSIGNPLANSKNPFTFAAMPLMGQITPMIPADAIGSQPQQALEANNNSLAAIHPLFAVHNPPPPAKRSRTGTTKMRPSKTSTTPRNLCALEWAVSNPKGTADEFSTYYDGLSAEGKEKWEKLSLEAKASGKTASESI